jgi:DNA-binding transcriptional regulator GbsR (MarR family)
MDILPFTFQNTKIRTVLINSKPWFFAKDISEILGFSSKSSISNALKDLDEDELGSFKMNSGGQVREFKIVSESGLYTLIIRSRKTGSYSISKPEKRTDLISVSDSELDRELKALKFILDNFNLSEKEKIIFTNQTLEKINFQTLENPHLKKIEPVFSLTDLLKEFGISETAHQFNLKLESFGIIERQENGWQIVNMKYGRNLPASFGNNPKYFKSTFQELLDL